jgi:hypothetical protein
MAWIPLQTIGADAIRELCNGEYVHVRLSRLWEPEPHVIYDGPAVIVRDRNVIVFGGEGVPSWADYDVNDRFGFGSDGSLIGEDYLAEISERLGARYEVRKRNEDGGFEVLDRAFLEPRPKGVFSDSAAAEALALALNQNPDEPAPIVP